ncbi:TPA: aromatic acid/H+ symport family MFS transporter, partial [Serratia marcescens]
FGGILGAMSGGVLMQMQLSFSTIFTLLAIPALIAALALLAKHLSGGYPALPAPLNKML